MGMVGYDILTDYRNLRINYSMTKILPATAYRMVTEGRIQELRRGKISPHLTWGEVFHNRTDARIAESLTVQICHNAYRMATMMEFIRSYLGGKAIRVTSWFRDPTSNREVGGASRSWHLTGLAVDFQVSGMTNTQVQSLLEPIWQGGLGLGGSFTHLDMGSKRRPFTY